MLNKQREQNLRSGLINGSVDSIKMKLEHEEQARNKFFASRKHTDVSSKIKSPKSN